MLMVCPCIRSCPVCSFRWQPSVKKVMFSRQLSILVLSIDKEEKLVNLSLLPVDTGKPDILPESLGLPLRLIGEEKKKHDTQRMKNKRKLSESKQVTGGLSFLSRSHLHLTLYSIVKTL